MYAVIVWMLALVLGAAIILLAAWAGKPALLGAWTWIVTPRDGERLQQLGVVAMRRGLVAIPSVMGISLLFRATLGPPLDRAAIVNYVTLMAVALPVAVVYVIATRRNRRRGGG